MTWQNISACRFGFRAIFFSEHTIEPEMCWTYTSVVLLSICRTLSYDWVAPLRRVIEWPNLISFNCRIEASRTLINNGPVHLVNRAETSFLHLAFLRHNRHSSWTYCDPAGVWYRVWLFNAMTLQGCMHALNRWETSCSEFLTKRIAIVDSITNSNVDRPRLS